jgi:hypothetical protein
MICFWSKPIAAIAVAYWMIAAVTPPLFAADTSADAVQQMSDANAWANAVLGACSEYTQRWIDAKNGLDTATNDDVASSQRLQNANSNMAKAEARLSAAQSQLPKAKAAYDQCMAAMKGRAEQCQAESAAVTAANNELRASQAGRDAAKTAEDNAYGNSTAVHNGLDAARAQLTSAASDLDACVKREAAQNPPAPPTPPTEAKKDAPQGQSTPDPNPPMPAGVTEVFPPPLPPPPPPPLPPVAVGPPPPYVPPAVTPPAPGDSLTCNYTDASGQQQTSFTTKDPAFLKQGCPPNIFPGLILVRAPPGGGPSGPLTPLSPPPLTPVPPAPPGPVTVGPPQGPPPNPFAPAGSAGGTDSTDCSNLYQKLIDAGADAGRYSAMVKNAAADAALAVETLSQCIAMFGTAACLNVGSVVEAAKNAAAAKYQQATDALNAARQALGNLQNLQSICNARSPNPPTKTAGTPGGSAPNGPMPPAGGGAPPPLPPITMNTPPQYPPAQPPPANAPTGPNPRTPTPPPSTTSTNSPCPPGTKLYYCDFANVCAASANEIKSDRNCKPADAPAANAPPSGGTTACPVSKNTSCPNGVGVPWRCGNNEGTFTESGCAFDGSDATRAILQKNCTADLGGAAGALEFPAKDYCDVAPTPPPKVYADLNLKPPTDVPACESKPPFLPWGGHGSASITVSGGKPCGIGWHDTGATILDSMTVTSQPSHGTLKPQDQHIIIFTPKSDGYKGPDSFTLSMKEHNGGRRATMSVKVSVTIQ